MRTHLTLSVAALALVSGTDPAFAQGAAATQTAQVDAEAEPLPAEDEIVVIAERLAGEVQTDLPPILELNEEEIASYGADSLADLVAQLAPQTGSGRGRGSGRPVFLINGQRVGSFREFRRYPPEAIRKVEVLPEEVALQFGYPADQRVINFILKDDFKSREIEVEYGGSTAGGSASGEIEGSQLSISGPNRLNLGAQFTTQSLLTEAERGIVQQERNLPGLAGDPDPARFRSLRADSEAVEFEATLNSALGEGARAGSWSLNGNITREYANSLSGLDIVAVTDVSGQTALDADPLRRRTKTTTISTGGSIAKPLGDWQSNLTVDAVHADTATRIDRRRDDGPLPSVADPGFDSADSRTWSVVSLATLSGNPLELPAGDVSVTFNSGLDWMRIESEDTRANVPISLTRRRLSAGASASVPVAESGAAWGAIGDLSLNLSAGLEELSDFGLIGSYTVGANWRPTERLSVTASYILAEQAPSLANLGGAQIIDFNVPVFDFTRGESVLATVVTGGNPALAAETQRDIKLALNYELDLFDRANIVVEYFRNRSEDVTESFPLLTPAIEAAFPGRVTRDAGGALLAIDRRPLTFAQRNSSRLRYGFNVFGRVGKETPDADDGDSGPSAAAPARRGSGAQTGGRARFGGFDPERMRMFRQALCAAEPGGVPDISGLPEAMQERLRGPDGQADPERIAAMRARMCAADGTALPPGEGGPAFLRDAEQRALIRNALCAQAAPGELPDLSALPEELLARLRGPDGEIDRERFALLRERVCQAPSEGAAEGAGRSSESRGGGGRSGRGGGGGGGGRFGGGSDQGRWQLSLYHSVEFENEALVAAGGPLLDLLDGDALGGGGISRHRVELEGGVFHKGIGARFSGNYASTTRVDGTGLPGSSALFFGDLATFDLRLFANLEEQKWLVGEEPGFFKGTRLSLRVDNIFDARQRVTDSTGTVPLSYQPGLIDPVGRFVEIELRKMF